LRHWHPKRIGFGFRKAGDVASKTPLTVIVQLTQAQSSLPPPTLLHLGTCEQFECSVQ
jgi:hypothetical protein